MNQLTDIVAKIEALPRSIGMWELDGEWLTSNEVQALAAEVKRLTEENTSITNALEFLGVECIDGDIRIQMSKKAKWARAQLAFDTLQIERLESEVKRLTEENARLCGYDHAAAELRWIPVSERLPDCDGSFLCSCVSTSNSSAVGVWQLGYVNGKWGVGYDISEYWTVQAWQPMPKPYYTEPTDLHVFNFSKGYCNFGCCKGEPADNIGEEEGV